MGNKARKRREKRTNWPKNYWPQNAAPEPSMGFEIWGGGAGNSLLSISVLFLNHQIMSGGRGVKPPSAPFLTRPLQEHPIRKKEEKNKEKKWESKSWNYDCRTLKKKRVRRNKFSFCKLMIFRLVDVITNNIIRKCKKGT